MDTNEQTLRDTIKYFVTMFEGKTGLGDHVNSLRLSAEATCAAKKQMEVDESVLRNTIRQLVEMFGGDTSSLGDNITSVTFCSNARLVTDMLVKRRELDDGVKFWGGLGDSVDSLQKRLDKQDETQRLRQTLTFIMLMAERTGCDKLVHDETPPLDEAGPHDLGLIWRHCRLALGKEVPELPAP